MRFSTVLPVALATAPLAVSAAAGRFGFALGARHNDGSCKTSSDYEVDFDTLKSKTTIVRTYSVVDGAIENTPCQVASAILPAAANKGFQVILGVWPDTDASFKADRDALKTAMVGKEKAVYAITVGSETLYRGNFTGPQLLSRINDIKSDHPGVKVGTADSWNKYWDGTADALITGGVEILLVNAFAYWQGQDISNATATYLDDLQLAIGHVQALSGSTTKIEIWNGETGWPGNGGTDYGSAKASTSNAAQFFKNGVCAAINWGYNVFYFEAFDEPWKPASLGTNGHTGDETHWGAYDQNRNLKFPLSC